MTIRLKLGMPDALEAVSADVAIQVAMAVAGSEAAEVEAGAFTALKHEVRECLLRRAPEVRTLADWQRLVSELAVHAGARVEHLVPQERLLAFYAVDLPLAVAEALEAHAESEGIQPAPALRRSVFGVTLGN